MARPPVRTWRDRLGNRHQLRARIATGVVDLYEAASWLHVAVFLFYGARFHPSYGLTWPRRLALARRMRRNTRRLQTGLSYRGHLAIAAKVFEVPPSTKGVMVEAGCWKGGTTVNLSLIAEVVGRTLVVYDSFEGLPTPSEGDHWASELGVGAFKGELEEVRANVERFGALGVCEFRKGWFSDTMGDHREPIVLAYVDVDYQSSFHDCILGLWPHLTSRGYMFIDEYTRLDYCALFFSERYWRTYFDRPPPGIMGAGSGVGLGQVFPGPLREHRPMQRTASVAWTRKDFYAQWDYEPGDEPEVPLAGGGIGDPNGRTGWTLTTESMQEHEAKLITELMKDDPAVREAVIAQALTDATAALERGEPVDAKLEASVRNASAQGIDDPRLTALLALLDDAAASREGAPEQV
jgi:hypothetical protein